MKTVRTALSLGAGLGSAGLCLMLEAGLMPGTPLPEVAIFADTMAEPSHVYDTLTWLQNRVSFPIVTVSCGDLRSDTWKQILGTGPTVKHTKSTGFVDIPVFSDRGPMKRQCTDGYKISVIHRAYREYFETKLSALQIDQYIGISIDEVSRVKPSQVTYITNKYPLVDHRISRQDIFHFMENNFPGHPVRRSACFFCPYHSIAEWKEIRTLYPDLYQEAIDMERKLKEMPKGPFYLYKGKYGLGLESSMDQADKQGMLWHEGDQFTNECEGHCGV